MMNVYDRLVGSWRLTDWKMSRGEVSLDPPLGPANRCEGLLIYTANHYMSATLSMRDRPKFATDVFDGGTNEEKRLAYENFLGYSGRFEVDEPSKTIEHHVEMSSYPNWVGQIQRRIYDLSEDTLILSVPSINIGNQTVSTYLCWQRL